MRKIFAALLLITACLSLAALSGARATQAGGVAPDEVYIKLRGIDGKMYDVAEMKGQVVLVSFGATWCAPCMTELQALEELRKEYQDKPVKFFWVSLDMRQHMSDRDLRDFAKANRLNFTVLRDATQLTYAQFSASLRLPYVVFFDRAGRLATPKQVGMARPEEYKQIIRTNLDKLLMAEAARPATQAK
ncbi:MAG TPA: TlpA disulfide reductase family protein [Pyrinomonadaceae bacterium]